MKTLVCAFAWACGGIPGAEADGPSTQGLISVTSAAADFRTAEVVQLPAVEVQVATYSLSPSEEGVSPTGVPETYSAVFQRPLQPSSDWWDWRVLTRNSSSSAVQDVDISIPDGRDETILLKMDDARVVSWEVFRGPNDQDYERITVVSIALQISRS